jgi:hypothetical protein
VEDCESEEAESLKQFRLTTARFHGSGISARRRWRARRATGEREISNRVSISNETWNGVTGLAEPGGLKDVPQIGRAQ